MLRIPIDRALPGMVLSVPVYHPDRPDSVLLNASNTLTGSSITHLKRSRIRSVRVHHPEFKFVDSYVHPNILRLRQEIEADAASLHQRLLTEIPRDARGQIDPPKSIDRLISELLLTRDSLVFIDEPPPDYRSPLEIHAGSVCFLSALLALELHPYLQRQRRRASARPQDQAISLCFGAMLHDIGLRKVAISAYENWVETGDESDPRWQVHAELGYKMVANRIDSTVAAVVLQHHHYFNGGGFPSRSDWDGESHGVAGEEIHVFARIVTVADQFDELRNRPDGSIWPSVRALRWLLEKSRWMRLDPHIAQALLRITPVYSPGSLVRLSTGEEGFVLDWKPGNPCRPSVAIVENLNVLTDVGSPGPTAETFGEATGQSVPDATELRFAHWSDSIRFKVVDLARSTEIHVAETEGVKVAEDNFILPREIRPRTRDGQPYGDLQAA